jgi:hypothetical protein
MRYLAVLGFNTKQWWVYDNEVDIYIDPPIEVLNELEEMSAIAAAGRLTQIANADPTPDWLFDKDYWYDGDI